MTRMRFAALLLMPLFLIGAALAEEGCDEYFNVGSGPMFNAFGAQPNGDHVGQGQTFTLNCGAGMVSAVFNLTWGNPCGDVRALASGDTLHLSLVDMAGVEHGRRSAVLDSNIGAGSVSWYFHDVDVLLPIGTYAAVVWTPAEACGGIRYRTEDLVAGQRWRSTTSSDFTTYAGASGELVSTITLDSDVTGAEEMDWSTLKAGYR